MIVPAGVTFMLYTRLGRVINERKFITLYLECLIASVDTITNLEKVFFVIFGINLCRYEYFVSDSKDKIILHGERNYTVVGDRAVNFMIKNNYISLDDFSILQVIDLLGLLKKSQGTICRFY